MRKLSRVPMSERCWREMTFRSIAAKSAAESARPSRPASSAATFASPAARASLSMKLLNISPAARRENVSATMRSGSTPPKMSARRRETSENVLPVPAEASITVSGGRFICEPPGRRATPRPRPRRATAI